MLPRELSVSIAVGPEKPSSIVDIDHLLQCAFRAIEVIRPITRASTSESVLLGPAYTAYTSSTVQVSRELLDTYQWLVQGRKLGRDYRERVLSGALDVNYAVRLFEVYTQVPRKCKFAVDYVNGLRGLLPVDTTILLASTNPVTVVEDLMEALKVATGRLWATGGFIKVGQLERLWWTTSIPKVMNSSLFLQGTSHSGFYSTKERREIPGVVVDATELEILGFAGLKTKVADRENGEVVYSFKRRTCGIHEPTDMTGSGSRRDATRRMDSEELSAVGVLGFLQSVLLRLGHEGSDFHEGVDQLISLRLSGGEEETSTLRREIRHCLRTMGNTRESLIFQNPITTGNVDIKFTSTELMELFQLTRPDLDVMVEMMPSCGCRFAMPHVLVQNLARRWLGDKGYLLNLSAITPLNEVLDISICKVVQKIPMLDKLMGTADKGTPTSTTSSSRRTGEAERRAKVYYTSAFDLASNKELFGELLGDVGKVLDDAFCMSVKGIMFSLRDSLDTHGIPEFYDKVRMYERTANVYTVFATHKDGEYDTDTRQLERRAIGNFVKLKGELMVRKSKV
ncbi:hypothetical protein BJ742DRAFT_307472 [Cladochytrium replicatum]|nr:hypothetical protein BJ742DRAFT_307472 [Cladochytrium replicatum]